MRDPGKAPNLWPALIVMTLTAVPWLTGCPSDPKPPQPRRDIDAGPPVSCDAYCKHIRELGCAQAKATRKGADCETVCRNIESSGYVENTRACSMAATTCAGVDACEE